MASSRWKRFAFFDRHTLTVPPEVLDDLIPAVKAQAPSSSTSATVANDGDTSSSSTGFLSPGDDQVTRSLRALTLTGQEVSAQNDTISLVVTTAALPLLSKPVVGITDKNLQSATSSNSSVTTAQQSQQQQQQQSALDAMWTSLTACSALDGSGGGDYSNTIELPSQGQQSLVSSQQQRQNDPARGSGRGAAVDGLVLCFVSSRNTQLVHCFDLTVRCNPPPVTKSSTDGTTETDKALEDMDGWRGYYDPFPPQLLQQQQPISAVATTRQPGRERERARDNIVEDSGTKRVIVSIAACRCQDRHRPVLVASITNHNLVVWEDPHLHLLYRRPINPNANTPPSDATLYSLANITGPSSVLPPQQQQLWTEGEYRVVDVVPGMVAIGTSTGAVLFFVYQYAQNGARKNLRPYLRIPPPPATSGLIEVVSVQLTLGDRKAHAFVSYNRKASPATSSQRANSNHTATTNNANQSTVGICCYEIPLSTMLSNSSNLLSAPSARHDLDGRFVGSSNLVDSVSLPMNTDSNEVLRLTVARPDGLYSYSKSERTGVAPIDGTKLAFCIIPPPTPAERRREVEMGDDMGIGCGYVLVASTDAKSGRDAVDIYDVSNNLVAFHLLLSPGHRALRAAGVTTQPASSRSSTRSRRSNSRGGLSSAVVLTSGGALVSFTEKRTDEKISLLVQKNLYSAAIVVAYSDPSYEASQITSLYQTYAEHLYQKGDFNGAIEQYMQTIGSLESSHVIFRFLDAPKIPLLVKYLEKLRSLSLATPVHNDLLRTCYLKLNDSDAAEALAVSNVSNQASKNNANVAIALSSILSNLATNPKEALAAVCALEAQQAVEILVVHGASLARALPRETAGVVLSLCLGTFSPKALAEASILNNPSALYKMLQYNNNSVVDHPKNCDPYPVHLFLPRTFVEHPKMLRLVLAHCNRNKCPLTPSLRRTLLELTLAEWNQAKRSGDTETEKLRHKEAIAALTDSHSKEIGDYDALVIVQLAGFEEGELLLFERLQMTPMVLQRYASDGSEKSRRRMLAMCHSDPEILADVLSHFVSMASEKLNASNTNQSDRSESTDLDEIMEEIQECLVLAKKQGVLPPVRIARILAGEHAGQFSIDRPPCKGGQQQQKRTVPLSVALEYVGTLLEESRTEISRLRTEVEEYNQLCNAMENEINSLLRISGVLPAESTLPLNPGLSSSAVSTHLASKLSIDDLYCKIRAADDSHQFAERVMQSEARESFWREMNQSEDSFETISRFFAKGVMN